MGTRGPFDSQLDSSGAAEPRSARPGGGEGGRAGGATRRGRAPRPGGGGGTVDRPAARRDGAGEEVRAPTGHALATPLLVVPRTATTTPRDSPTVAACWTYHVTIHARQQRTNEPPEEKKKAKTTSRGR